MEYGLFPIWSGWISQEYKPGVHKGIDIGWLVADGENLPVRAWKSGTVIASGVDTEGGVYVVINHEDNQWSGYWHLVKGSNIAKGTVVKQGDKVGIRGNSGLSSGTHLHFLITKTGMGVNYGYAKMVSNTVDPLPLCYKLPTDNIECASSKDQYPLPLMPIVPDPVERNEDVHQVEVLAEALRVRKLPGIYAEVIGVCKKGYFNVLEKAEVDGYIWFKIDKDRWIATNDEEGWTVDLPDHALERRIEELEAQVKELTSKNKTLTSRNKSLNTQLTNTKNSLKEAETKISGALEVLSK